MDIQSLIFPLLIVLIAVPMFLQARKQKKLMQEQQKLQNSLNVGDRVMTTSGLFGTVVDTAEDSIDLEISPGITTTWVRAAVREKVNTEEAEVSETPADDVTDAKADPDSGAKAEESGAEVAEPIEKQKTN